jgi:hypothetical protein
MIRLRLPTLFLFCLFVGISGVTNAQTACPLSPQLTIGQRGVVLGTSPNNLRAGPARNEAIIAEIPGGGVFDVLAGPECDPDSGINWWQVNYAGQVGWTAEGDTSTYFVEPIHPALLYRSFEFNAPVGEDGRTDLAMHDLVTDESNNLTADIPLTLTPDITWRIGNFSWTPEADRIAFTVETNIPFQNSLDTSVYLMNTDGSGKCLLTENAELMDTGRLAIRPAVPQNEDGAPLGFPLCENPSQSPSAGWRIEIDQQEAFAINLETDEQIQLTNLEMGRAAYGGEISPDGTFAAVNVMDDNYDYVLYLIPIANPQEATPVVLSSEPTGALRWSSDGDLLLIGGENEMEYTTTLNQLNVATGVEQILYTGFTASLPLASPIFSPSGAQIAFADPAEVEPGVTEPRLYLMNADGSNLQMLNTLDSLGPILWRPE